MRQHINKGFQVVCGGLGFGSFGSHCRDELETYHALSAGVGGKQSDPIEGRVRVETLQWPGGIGD